MCRFRATEEEKRTISVSVIMMSNYCSTVPKGKERHKLAAEGRMLNMKVTRGIKISTAFDVAVLECDKNSHSLIKCCDQEVDGDAIAQRRGCLYLCEIFEVG